MPRFLLSFALVLALHLGVGWLLHGLRAEPGVAVRAPEAMLIQLVSPEPAPVPRAAPKPVARPLPAARPAQSVKAPRPEPRPMVTSKPQPAPARQMAKAEPVEPRSSEAASAPPTKAADAVPSHREPPALASTPATRAADMEVFSREPEFLTPPKPPIYPAQARRRNQQGLVLVEARLDADGHLRELRLLRSSGVESLDRSAMDAVANWRFRPETQNGLPVPSRVHIPIEFALSASR
ncbi:energy transducer TonB [Pseudomonas sp. BN411]|nr:energy transducer TonB [Pseudomonas sp. BN411]